MLTNKENYTDINEVKKIIDSEKLSSYNLNNTSIKPNEVGILLEGSKWKVYTSDARANPISEK
ncbi:hypothetical protein [Ornithinibacillus xuwenensis]|uniref:Uncharacterized protein n=1 Tax=Ornithinibacillus xuwenensis TaxID=3144668 RepID=A0ABU9XPC3_9BACI